LTHRPYKRPQAEIDVTSIWNYIAGDSAKAADALLIASKRPSTCWAQNPFAGHARDELMASLRSFPVASYIIFYVPVSDGIEVVRVMSGYRDITPDDME